MLIISVVRCWLAIAGLGVDSGSATLEFKYSPLPDSDATMMRNMTKSPPTIREALVRVRRLLHQTENVSPKVGGGWFDTFTLPMSILVASVSET